MGALKQANKVLLVALGVAIILVIAAIVILAITLGKANNLNSVAPALTSTAAASASTPPGTASTPAPTGTASVPTSTATASPPTSTATAPPPTSTPTTSLAVLPCYFTVVSGSVSYANASSNYTGTVKILQNQISNALLQSGSRLAEQYFEAQYAELDASTSFTTPYIMGINPYPNGGVAVIASTTFYGSNVPTINSVSAKLSGANLAVLQMTDNTGSASDIGSQLCSQVNNETVTTTVSPATSTVTPVTATGSTQDPCRRDIVLLMDTSNGLGSVANFQAELSFIGSVLVANWAVGPTHIEVDPVVYDSTSFDQLGAFTFQSTTELQQTIAAIAAMPDFLNDPPSIAYALSNEITELNGQRSGVAQVTVLFTSTSVQADVTKALPSATQLKSSGTTIIVVGIGSNVIPSILTPLASNPSLVFTASDFTSLASNTALANQINTAIGICGGSITQSTASGTPSASTPSITPPSTPSVTTPSSATSLPTTPSTGPTPDPTRRDIIILMDTSSGLGSVANFQAELNFIASVLVANWTVGPIHVEVDPVVYDSDSFQEIGAFTFKDTAELQQAIAAIAAMPDFLSDPPSIAYNQNDINQALPAANQLKGNGSTIIVVALGPNADPNILGQLSSGAGYTFNASDYNSLNTNFALGSQMNQAVGATYAQNPCWQDIYLMIDTSKGLGLLTNFQAQMAFIASTLITNWNVSPGGVEAEVFLYDNKLPLNEHGAFDFTSTLDLKNLIVNWNTYFLQDNPSLTVAFQAVINNHGNSQRFGAKPVTLLFTSTSDSFDISQARPLANQLRNLGHTIVIVAMGTNADVNQLMPLSSGSGYVFQANNYTAFRTDSVLAANVNQAIGICTGSTTVGGPTTTPMAATTPSVATTKPTAATTTPSVATTKPTAATTTPSVATTTPSVATTTPSVATSTSTAATTTPTVTTTTTSPVPLPCAANFALLIDTSNGMTADQFTKQLQFIANTLFQANWTYSQWGIAQYDTDFFLENPFGSLKSLVEAQGIVQHGIFQSGQTARISNALTHTIRDFATADTNQSYSQKTIFFTSTSAPDDVTVAIQPAEHVQALGDLIVVGMGTNVNMTLLTRLASPNSAFAWSDYNNPGNLATQIINAFLCT